MRHLICNKIGTPYFNYLMSLIERDQYEKSEVYTDLIYYPNISTFFYMAGESEKALSYINLGISKFNSEKSLIIEKCKLLILLQHYLTAATILENLEIKDDPYILFERIKLAMLTKNPMEARNFSEKVLDTIKDKEDFLIQLTFFFIINHMKERALECWEVACKNPLKSFDFKLAQVALCYEYGEYKDAHKICHYLYRFQPTNLVVLLYDGYTYYKMHQYNRVTKCIQILKQIHPRNIDTIRLENYIHRCL